MSEKTGRFEYVKRGIVGMCAATLLTGLCAVPAFAATGFTDPTVDGTNSYADGSATTAVKAEAAVANISATVPTAVTAVVKPSGDLLFPSTGFAIAVTEDTTNGTWPIAVSNVSVALSTSSFAKGLASDVASMDANKNAYVAMNGTALSVGDNKAAAIAPFAFNATDGWTHDIVLTGQLKDPTYTQAFAGVALVDLTWTIAAA